MKILTTTLLLTSLLLNQAYAAKWSYKDNTAPEKWASLSAENSLCGTGQNQSPLNIDTKKTANFATRGVKFNYGMTRPESITNTGNLIQVKTRGWANINVDDTEFKLIRIDFHIPSEHTIDGKHFPMELQFIHKSEKGKLAIVSKMAVPGRPDRALRRLFEKLPMKAGITENLPPNALKNIEMKKKYGNYYRYNGSLTTPPCSEGVRWFVMKSTMTFSKEQYEKLKLAVPQDNNRPLQALNARLILE